MEPVVSVRIITFNQGKYIRQCLDSVLSQRVNFPYEIVLGEDNSSDDTREICLEYANRYPEIIRLFLREEKDRIFIEGKPTGRFNFLETLKECKGKYIAVLDGDDYWTDVNKLQKQVDFLETNHSYVIHCGNSIIVSPNPKLNGTLVHKSSKRKREYTLEDFTTDSQIVSGTAVFRNVLDHSWPSDFYKIKAGDWFLWIYLMQKTGLSTYYADETLGAYRMHGAGIFSSLSEKDTMEFYSYNLGILSKQFLDRKYRYLAESKLKWYQVQLFRLYVDAKDYRRALLVWIKLKSNSSHANRLQLLHEMKNAISFSLKKKLFSF